MGEFFYAAFFILLIPLAIALFVGWWKLKKLYSIGYTLFVFSFVNTIIFIFDAFDLGRGGILFMLILSAAVLIGLGYWLNNRKRPAA